MQAIILAAGMGKRLKELTNNNTKCMVKVNGVTMIERMLTQLDQWNLNRIVIVVGYEGQKLIDYIATLSVKTPIQFIDNPIYYKTNNIYSLALAKEKLCEDDTMLLESDLIFEDSVLSELMNDPRQTLALVDKYESWMDGTCVTLDDEDNIKAFIPGKNFRYEDIPSYYKTVNIYKFSREFSTSRYVPFLTAYEKALGENEYYEQVLRVITMLDEPEIQGKRLTGQKWYEIDDVQDLDIAESIFAPTLDEKLRKMEGRYGGYWRYPKLMDFCYLVNPFFPPQKLVDEMKSNFDRLLFDYPSGMHVNSLLAARYFELTEQDIVVGNGAAELIKVLMEDRAGKIGVIRPTFEEYPNRSDRSSLVVYDTTPNGYTYTADDLMTYFTGKELSTLVLINPDNPSGNYIPRADLIRLADWAKGEGLQLIIDESFVDFADEMDATLLKPTFLHRYPHVVVVKSISKSYGVPGLRLGVMASGDRELIAALKKKVAIWNINSFGEFYMQIFERYRKDYVSAMARFRAVRQEYMELLRATGKLEVLPSQANYIMCRVLGDMSSRELIEVLLDRYEILAKDLSRKPGISGNYIRLAVKTPEENRQLVAAINQVL